LTWLFADCNVQQERIKELTDKFNAELEADRQKFDLLLQEKNEQELEYEEKLKQVHAQGLLRPGLCRLLNAARNTHK
jgi:hypothetical protein